MKLEGEPMSLYKQGEVERTLKTIYTAAVLFVVDYAVCSVYASAPQTAQAAFEWFGFSYAGIGAFLDVFYKCVYFFERFVVLPLPPEVVVPCPVLPQ